MSAAKAKVKTFFRSRLNWIGIGVFLLPVLEYLYNLINSNPVFVFDFHTISSWVIGLLIVIVRTKYTSQPITKADKSVLNENAD